MYDGIVLSIVGLSCDTIISNIIVMIYSVLINFFCSIIYCCTSFISTGPGAAGGGMRGGGGGGGRGRGRGRGSKEHQLIGKTIRITRGPYKGEHSL